MASTASFASSAVAAPAVESARKRASRFVEVLWRLATSGVVVKPPGGGIQRQNLNACSPSDEPGSEGATE
ncbi:MAG: hypothetical protein CL927_06155 [Deltaproteobacteria bacterium]|nr:hypothetical protein [Deltaproteobacteria bacterium]HCH62439.1 hypothetical protein [Deltaproteobacteria bacterium]